MGNADKSHWYVFIDEIGVESITVKLENLAADSSKNCNVSLQYLNVCVDDEWFDQEEEDY